MKKILEVTQWTLILFLAVACFVINVKNSDLAQTVSTMQNKMTRLENEANGVQLVIQRQQKEQLIGCDNIHTRLNTVDERIETVNRQIISVSDDASIAKRTARSVKNDVTRVNNNIEVIDTRVKMIEKESKMTLWQKIKRAVTKN